MKREFSHYLVTGATGFLGSTLINLLARQGKKVRALILPGDPGIDELPETVEKCFGNVSVLATLSDFFRGDLSQSCLIHCAGVVSISSRRDPKLWRVNVEGTKNVLNLAHLHCVGRVVYISSVHAIRARKSDRVICETDRFSAHSVRGRYAKTKAVATSYALSMAAKGLDLCVVHPSGIIGPGDRAIGNTTAAVINFCKGALPVSVKGGYDFVDVRDVAGGVIDVCEQGLSGECYLLTGHYLRLNDIFTYLAGQGYAKPPKTLSLWLIKALAPFFEWSSAVRKQKPFLTPYSAYTLGANANFSHAKASTAFGYEPRDWRESIDDLVAWCKETGRLQIVPKPRACRRARRRPQKEKG